MFDACSGPEIKNCLADINPVFTEHEGTRMENLLSEKQNGTIKILLIYMLIYYPLASLGIRYYMGISFVILCLMYSIIKSGMKINISRLTRQYLLMVFVMTIMYLLPNARWDIRSTGIQIFNFGLFMLFTLSYRTNKKEIAKVLKWLIIVAVVFSCYIIICKVYPAIYKDWILPHLSGLDKSKILQDMGRGYGVQIGGSSIYGDYIISCAAFAGFGYLTSGRYKKYRLKILLVEFLFLLAVVIEGRRGEAIAFICSFIVLFISTTDFINRRKLIGRLGVLFLLLFAVIIVFIVMFRHGMMTRFVSTFQKIISGKGTADISSGRFLLWQTALNKFIDSPIIGIGWGRFKDYIPAPYNTVLNNVHNTYLQFLCETGIVGTILLLVPIGYVFVCTLKHTRRLICNKNRDPIAYTANITSFGMQTFFGVINFLDPSFYSSLYCVMFALCIILEDYALKDEIRIRKEKCRYV